MAREDVRELLAGHGLVDGRLGTPLAATARDRSPKGCGFYHTKQAVGVLRRVCGARVVRPSDLWVVRGLLVRLDTLFTFLLQ